MCWLSFISCAPEGYDYRRLVCISCDSFGSLFMNGPLYGRTLVYLCQTSFSNVLAIIYKSQMFLYVMIYGWFISLVTVLAAYSCGGS